MHLQQKQSKNTKVAQVRCKHEIKGVGGRNINEVEVCESDSVQVT